MEVNRVGCLGVVRGSGLGVQGVFPLAKSEIRGLGLGVWVSDFGFGTSGFGFGDWGLGFGVWGLGFGVRGLRFEVWGVGFRV